MYFTEEGIEMINTIIVSVVVCTYNRAHLLRNCLQSLCDQPTGTNGFEIIIVDNNSTDDTKYVITSFIKSRLNIRFVEEYRQGLSYARNRGWKEARGTYVAYIDDDSIAGRDWMKEILLFIKRHPGIRVFGGPYDRFSLTPIPVWLPENYYTLNLGNKIRALNLKSEWLSGSNMIFEKSVFEKYGGFKKNFGMRGNKILYGEETELLFRLKQYGEIVYYVPKIRVNHFVAEHKLHLWWMLKNDYWRSYSSALYKKPKFNFFRGIAALCASVLLVPTYFIDLTKGVLKRRIYFSLSNIFFALGQISASLK